MGSCFSQPLQKVAGPSNTIIGRSDIKKIEKDGSKIQTHEDTKNNSEDTYSYSYDYEEYDDSNAENNENQGNGAEVQHQMKIRRIRKPKNQVNEQQKSNKKQVTINEGGAIKIQSSNDPLSAQTRPYFSFTSFMIQNPSPQIYEWQFEQEIAKGSLSQIYLVRHTETGQICAAKVYNNAVLHLQTIGSNEEQPFLCVEREIGVLCKISHPNIISILEVIEDNPTNSLILVVPYASQGNLGDHIILSQSKQFEETQDPIMSLQNILVCFYQMCEALKYLHSEGYAHRNISPQSILILDNFYFSLSEFKYAEKILIDDNASQEVKKASKQNNTKLLTDVKGSTFFLSPEACSGKPYDGKMNDIWALGITFYLTIFGKFPYGLSDKVPMHIAAVTKAITENSLDFLPFFFLVEDEETENSIKLLISGMLQKDPKKRISLDECLNSPILTQAKEFTINQQKEMHPEQ